MILVEDNEGEVRLANNPLSPLRSNSIEVRYHSIRNEVKEGSIYVKHVRTESQRAGIPMTSLPLDVFEKQWRDIYGY